MKTHLESINEARLKYKPATIKCLFIAEAPPSNEDRFFYFENVLEQDSLYLEMMKALFAEDKSDEENYTMTSIFDGTIPTADLRNNKEDWLNKFKNEGYYLIDSSDQPMPYGMGTTKKIRFLEGRKNSLLEKVKPLVDQRTPIVLISVPVYQAMAGMLKYNGFNVIHNEPVPFPGSGQQKVFQEKMKLIINKYLKKQ